MKYDRSIDFTGDSSLAKLARAIPAQATVLDLGSGAGQLGAFLGADRACVVDGIDRFAREETPGYRRWIAADLATDQLAALVDGERYDRIVCADVLEHLVEPGELLDQLSALLAPAGQLLISTPNIAFAPLIAELMAGDFAYRPVGLLDDTHLRFFTRRSLLRFLGAHGFEAIAFDTVDLDPQKSEFAVAALENLPDLVRDHLLSLPDASAYQFIVIGEPTSRGTAMRSGVTFSAAPASAPRSLEFRMAVAWRQTGRSYTPTARVEARAVVGGMHQSVELELPPIDPPPVELRLDPADRPGLMRLHAIVLRAASGEIVWSIAPTASELAGCRLRGIRLADGDGGMLIAVTDIPAFIILPIDDGALAALRTGGALTMALSWPLSSDYLTLLDQHELPLHPDHPLQRRLEALERARYQLILRNEQLTREIESLRRDRRDVL